MVFAWPTTGGFLIKVGNVSAGGRILLHWFYTPSGAKKWDYNSSMFKYATVIRLVEVYIIVTVSRSNDSL